MLSDTTDLFSDSSPGQGPLAERLRPSMMSDVVGQAHLLGLQSPLHKAIDKGELHSFLLWGPPGCGKTTLARLLAKNAGADFKSISAVLSGVKDIRAAVESAKLLKNQSRQMVLFVDEVHRFNKSQQDAFLPHIEDGSIIFVGATTENPAFELNDALLSRLRVYILKALDESALLAVVERAKAQLCSELSLQSINMDSELAKVLVRAADGDARRLLNGFELAVMLGTEGQTSTIDAGVLEEALGVPLRRFDKNGDFFYDQISALHKSVRGSDPDASLYWFCRMLDGGADPMYIGRRLIRMASEDIGNADPRALGVCVEAVAAFERLGSPEGELALAQAVVYLAVAAKSNAVYTAYNAIRAQVAQHGTTPVPAHLRNAVSGLSKQQGHGDAYQYPHDLAHGFAPGVKYLPEGFSKDFIYQPVERGLEKQIKQRLAFLRSLPH